MNRRLALLAGALVLFGLLLATVLRDVGKRGTFAGRYSTWSSHPDGARAAYLTLERMGLPVVRRTQDLADLGTETSLVMLGPTIRIARYETAALVEWLDRGGTLVILPERDTPLLEKLGLEFRRGPGGPDFSRAPLFADDEEDEDEAGAPDAKRKGGAPGKTGAPKEGGGKDGGGQDGATKDGASKDGGGDDTADGGLSPKGASDRRGGGPPKRRRTAGAFPPSTQPFRLTDPFVEADKTAPSRLVPAQPSECLRGVAELRAIVAGTLRPRADDVDFTPLLLDENGQSVGGIVHRKNGGRAVVIAAPDLFANRRLGAADNALFLQALALDALPPARSPDTAGDDWAPQFDGGRPPSGGARPHEPARRLVLDEYHHGFTGSRTVVGYLWRGDLRLVLFQLGLLGLLVLARTWRRFGPAGEPPESSQSARDYLRAMSRIYRLGGHRAEAARRIWAYAARRIAASLGLSARSAQGANAADEIESIGLHDLARLYRRAEDRVRSIESKGTDEDLLEFGRAVAALEAAAEKRRTSRRSRRREVE